MRARVRVHSRRVSAHPFLTQGYQHGQVPESSQENRKFCLCVATHVGFSLGASNPDLITHEQRHRPAGSTESIVGGPTELGKTQMDTWPLPFSFGPF